MHPIVLIVVDALRADHVDLGSDGSGPTPNLGRLAARGVVFTEAVAQAPWTRPSVASLLTGLYPSQHGLVDRVRNVRSGRTRVAGLHPEIPTLPELLSAHGVRTAAFLGGNANLRPVFGLTRGFAHVDWRPTTDGSAICEGLEAHLAGGLPERSFLYLHFMDVHHPLPAAIRSRLDHGLDLSAVAESQAEPVSYYRAAVERVDRHVGRALRALEDAGAGDATVIVTADHGEELMEHGAMLAHGRTLYRELIRVPLLVALGREGPTGTVDPVVELVDVLPTIMDIAGLDAPDHVAGRSLLPSIGGERSDRGGAAFAELLRRDRYAQTVVTDRHQLIVSFQLEEVPAGSRADLRPGLGVKVEGMPTADADAFVATKVSLKPDSAAKVRGSVERIDPDARRLRVLGLDLVVDEDAVFLGLEREPFSLAELRVGDKVSATFGRENGDRRVTHLKRRKPGGKAKIEGPIERVRDLGDGLLSITVLGLEVPIDGVGVSGSWRDKTSYRPKADALARVLQGGSIARRVELYDLREDPAQSRNLADERPEVVADLEARLASWTLTLAAGPRGDGQAVDIDAETLQQLRLMGYVD